MTIYLRRENARRDARARQRGIPITQTNDERLEEERQKGDKAEFFRYTV